MDDRWCWTPGDDRRHSHSKIPNRRSRGRSLWTLLPSCWTGGKQPLPSPGATPERQCSSCSSLVEPKLVDLSAKQLTLAGIMIGSPPRSPVDSRMWQVPFGSCFQDEPDVQAALTPPQLLGKGLAGTPAKEPQVGRCSPGARSAASSTAAERSNRKAVSPPGQAKARASSAAAVVKLAAAAVSSPPGKHARPGSTCSGSGRLSPAKTTRRPQVKAPPLPHLKSGKGCGKGSGSSPVPSSKLHKALPTWSGPEPAAGLKSGRVINWQPIRSVDRWHGSIWERIHEEAKHSSLRLPETMLEQAFMQTVAAPAPLKRSMTQRSRKLPTRSALTADLLHVHLKRSGIQRPQQLYFVTGCRKAGSSCGPPNDFSTEVSLEALEKLILLLTAAEVAGDAAWDGTSHYEGVPPVERFLSELYEFAGPLQEVRARVDVVSRMRKFHSQAAATEQQLLLGLHAARCVFESASLPVFLHGLLQLGNYVNASSTALGGAVAVSLESLPKLAHTRCLPSTRLPARRSTTHAAGVSSPNALQFLMQHLKAENPSIAERLSADLSPCVCARDVDLAAEKACEEDLGRTVELVEALSRADVDGQPPAPALQPARLREFLSTARPLLAKVQATRAQLEEAAQQLRCHFAEAPSISFMQMIKSLAMLAEAVVVPERPLARTAATPGRLSAAQKSSPVRKSPSVQSSTRWPAVDASVATCAGASRSPQLRLEAAASSPQNARSSFLGQTARRCLPKPRQLFGPDSAAVAAVETSPRVNEKALDTSPPKSSPASKASSLGKRLQEVGSSPGATSEQGTPTQPERRACGLVFVSTPCRDVNLTPGTTTLRSPASRCSSTADASTTGSTPSVRQRRAAQARDKFASMSSPGSSISSGQRSFELASNAAVSTPSRQRFPTAATLGFSPVSRRSAAATLAAAGQAEVKELFKSGCALRHEATKRSSHMLDTMAASRPVLLRMPPLKGMEARPHEG
eukprot:TRINITY_DN25716_c0_g1_i1.p1 TRINITY_DN25716_c0_g1~~TRINITY_DN25716_c0_g1_i1.p1  ORF type:complete len:972 (-),score=161.94 TRINITY_DN25716_c0_g1_i1:326-3241(-)